MSSLQARLDRLARHARTHCPACRGEPRTRVIYPDRPAPPAVPPCAVCGQERIEVVIVYETRSLDDAR